VDALNSASISFVCLYMHLRGTQCNIKNKVFLYYLQLQRNGLGGSYVEKKKKKTFCIFACYIEWMIVSDKEA